MMLAKDKAEVLRRHLGLDEVAFEAEFGSVSKYSNGVLPPFLEAVWIEYWRLRTRLVLKSDRYSNPNNTKAIKPAVLRSWIEGEDGPDSDDNIHRLDEWARRVGVSGPSLDDLLRSLKKQGRTREAVEEQVEKARQAEQTAMAAILDEPPLPGRVQKAVRGEPEDKELTVSEFFTELPQALATLSALRSRMDAMEDLFDEVGEKTQRVTALQSAIEGATLETLELKDEIIKVREYALTLGSGEAAIKELKQGQKDATFVRGELGKKVETLLAEITDFDTRMVGLEQRLQEHQDFFDALADIEEAITGRINVNVQAQLGEVLRGVREQVSLSTQKIEEYLSKALKAPSQAPSQTYYPAIPSGEVLTAAIEKAVAAYLAENLRATVIDEFGELNAQDMFAVFETEEGRAFLRRMLGTPGTVRRTKE